MRRADSLALPSVGKSMLARIEMIAITTNNSISVKARAQGRNSALARIVSCAERPLITRMARKNIILILCAVVLAGGYVYYFTDWFASPDIQIMHTIRPNRQLGRFGRRNAPRPSSHTVSFALSRKLTLTEIKVIPASDLATNKHPHAIWHMISDSNSVPTKALVYGSPLRGMRPAVKGAWADPLESDTSYKLFLQSDAGKIEHDFKTPPGFPAPK